jgi:hypothetical protein
MEEEDELNRQRSALESAHQAHETESIAIAEGARALSKQLRTLDLYDAFAVDRYNSAAGEHDKAVAQFNVGSEQINAASETHRLAHAQYIAKCGTRLFLQSDREAILKERGKSAEPARAIPKAPRTVKDV